MNNVMYDYLMQTVKYVYLRLYNYFTTWNTFSESEDMNVVASLEMLCEKRTEELLRFTFTGTRQTYKKSINRIEDKLK